MRLPNGYGSVYKLSGKRRHPWCARKTVGWTFDPEGKKSYPVYKFVGYYSTRKEALEALAEYNADPYSPVRPSVTLQGLYDLWSEEHSTTVSKSAQKVAESAWKVLQPIADRNIRDLHLDHFQMVIDQSGKNTPMLTKVKRTLGMMYDYAVIHEYVPKDKREIIRHINVSKPGNPNKVTRSTFTTEEIETLWSHSADHTVSVVLILIYTGMRIGELFDLKKTDLHLGERYLYVRQSKTDAGVREVPIAEKIVPLITHLDDPRSDYVVSTTTGCKTRYNRFLEQSWTPTMKTLSMDHRPHDTRHTCISLLVQAGVDDRVIRQIVGHKGSGVTESVYTHIDLKTKLEAVNRL